MPSAKTKFRRRPFSCNHYGLGAYCHRCKEAERFEALATGKVKPSGKGFKASQTDKQKEHVPFKGWTKERFLSEAKRLRGEQVRKEKRGRKVVKATE